MLSISCNAVGRRRFVTRSSSLGSLPWRRRIGLCSTPIHCRRRRRCVEASNSDLASEEWTEPQSKALYTSPYDKEILAVAFPSLCSGLLGPLCTAVDTAVVGHLGTSQLSGVGVGAVVFMFVSNVFLFCQFLITPAVARAEARKESEKMSKIVGQSIRIGCVGGLLCGLVVFLLSGPIINLLHPPMQVRGFAVIYLRLMATSIPPFILYQCLAGILRGWREPMVIFKSSGVATVANVVLDILFVFGFHWGVFGAALATSLCTYVSTGMMLHRVLTSGKVKREHLLSHSVPESSGGTTKVVGDSIALIVRTLTLLGLIVCSSTLVAQQGPIVHSAFEICRLVFLLAHVTYTAFDITMQTLCAHYIGSKDKASARAVLIRASQLVFCMTSILSGGLLAFSSKFVRMFTDSAEVIAQFRTVTWPLLVPIPFAGLAAVIDGSLLGASRFKYIAVSQFIVGAAGMSLLFYLHHRHLLTLVWTTILVRMGLSLQIIVSWFVAFMMEYRIPTKLKM